ncbi:MAG TPA: hemerythrin domain-containing protein [Acidimicrobiales bacterium]|jgi:hemerythrin-like domain-containing protein|nr:hemerythrin domain-containing protein [Acidimicrobiales bacterium]
MTDSISLPLADTTDMIEMHRVFRKCFGAPSALVGSVPSGDSDRADLVASYYENVLRLLRVHHAGEDELVTPKLVARNPDRADLIEAIASQHTDVIALMDGAESELAGWRRSPDETSGGALIRALEQLDAELTVHLDAEEGEILATAATCMNVAEWGELPSHGMQHFDGDKRWLVIGLIREEMSDEHRVAMDAHMPPPIAAMWVESGQERYRQFIDRLLTPA